MGTNMNRTGDAQRTTVQCSCGKRLSALPQHAGKRVKCPACGQPVVVPGSSSPQPVPMATQTDDESEGISRNTLIALWSFVGVFALASVLFLVWHSHSLRQAKIAAANDRISQAVATANEWMAGKSSLDGETIEQQLTDALNDDDATEAGNGESVLSQVRHRREQLAEQTRIEQFQRRAAAIWNDAKRQIDGNRITEAITLLRKYVADPHATEKADAQRLLAEAETAVSDILTLDTLFAMTDEDFDQVKTTGEIRDGKVTHPVLISVRSAAIQRNLDKEVQRRQEIRIAEEKRREAQRLAVQRQEERQRQEAARRAVEERLQADEAERDKKIATALALFGDAAFLGGKAPDAATTFAMIAITKAALHGRKLAQGWPLAAKNVATNYKDVSITVNPTNQPTLEMVQSILGKEDSTEEDKKASVTWYKYGWCHFGVANKKVTILRADCNEINK